MDFSRVHTIPIADRKHKVTHSQFGTLPSDDSFAAWYDSLPDILGARDLKRAARAVAAASRDGREVIFAMGAHPIKCGLNPVIIDLMERGIVTGVALNGAGSIHDFELAFIGETSEDVAQSLKDGSFGMVEETGRILNEVMASGLKQNFGAGKSVGYHIANANYPYADSSIQAAGIRHGIDVTVHIAVGTDTIHVHTNADGAVIGRASYIDFMRFTDHIARLEGGVYLNIGSAVLLPEVFLKALSAVRNMGHQVSNFTAVNMDMQHQYRPTENVLKRPSLTGAEAISLIGQHEIMLPLLASSINLEQARL